MTASHERAFYEAAISRNQKLANRATDKILKDTHLAFVRCFELALAERFGDEPSRQIQQGESR